MTLVGQRRQSEIGLRGCTSLSVTWLIMTADQWKSCQISLRDSHGGNSPVSRAPGLRIDSFFLPPLVHTLSNPCGPPHRRFPTSNTTPHISTSTHGKTSNRPRKTQRENREKKNTANMSISCVQPGAEVIRQTGSPRKSRFSQGSLRVAENRPMWYLSTGST